MQSLMVKNGADLFTFHCHFPSEYEWTMSVDPMVRTVHRGEYFKTRYWDKKGTPSISAKKCYFLLILHGTNHPLPLLDSGPIGDGKTTLMWVTVWFIWILLYLISHGLRKQWKQHTVGYVKMNSSSRRRTIHLYSAAVFSIMFLKCYF